MRRGLLAALMALGLGATACSGGQGADTTAQPDSQSTSPSATAADQGPGTTAVETTTTTVADVEPVIEIANFAFSGPATVAVGTTVTVTNRDSFTHTWTSDDRVFDSGNLRNGESFEFTFDEPGEYAFFCAIHPTQMRSTITVSG